MLCQSKNVYSYEKIQNSLISDSQNLKQTKGNENEELQLFQQDKFYDKFKNNTPPKFMSNEEVLQEKARRQSMKNAFLSAQYDITMNKNNIGYRYKNNSFAQQFSLQHYFNSQVCNDLLFQQQQQQQLHQLSSLPDISSHLFQLQNNIVNYNNNPSFIFHSMKDSFFANQCCSQTQDLGYSPIGLSSQVQGPLLSQTNQFSKQYPQHNLNNLYNTSNNDSLLQNIDKENIKENINENSMNIENIDKCEKQCFNKETNKENIEILAKDNNILLDDQGYNKNEQYEELNQLKSKIKNNEPVNDGNVEVTDDKKDLMKEKTDDEKIVNDNIDEKIANEKIEMEIDIDKQSSHSNDEKKIDDINTNNEKEELNNKGNNKDKKSSFFNFIASPPFNDNKDLNNKINDEFTKPIQLQSPQSQSPIPNVKISRHIPLQLQSPQSQSQTPRQIKSPTFIIPSKKDNILTSPIEETKKILISPPTNDLNKFINMNEKLNNSIDISEISDDQDEKDVNENEHKKSTSKIIDNEEEENGNKDDSKNVVKLLNEHPSVFSETSENLLIKEQSVENTNIENEKKMENEKVDEIVEKNQDKVSIIDKLEAMDISSKDNAKQYDNENILEKKKEDKEKNNFNEKKKEEIQNQMEVDTFNTVEITKNKESLNQNEDPNIDPKAESLKNNDLSLENNDLNVLHAQPNTDIPLNQNPNYLNPDSEKYLNNNQLYPPRVNTLNPRFQRYLQQQQLMKSRSYSNIPMNYNSQGNPLYFPPKLNNNNYGIPNTNQIMPPPYYPLQHNKTLPPYPLYPNMMKQPNNHYINYPPHRPYSYPFSNIYSNNYRSMSYNYQYFGYNNNRLNSVNPNLMTHNNKPYGSSSTSSPIKIPPLSTFYKKDSNSQYLTQTLYNPINKRPSRLKIKSTLDKSSKSNWNNKKRYLNMVELDGVNYGNFSLKYLNFFLLKDKQETDNHGIEDCITIAELIIPNDVSKTVDITSISEDKLPDYQKIFDKYIQSTSFISLKVNFSFPKFLNEYLFMNTFIFESNVFRRVKCTTTVYSFGKRILETDEICNASLKENKYILNFEFVNKFFTDFLEKFQEFKTYDEIQLALENLAIMQQFNDITIFNEEPKTWLVIGYQFGIGNGIINIAKVKDLGFSD